MASTTIAPAGFDPDKFKATTRAQWQAAAEAWNRWSPLLSRWLGPATETMLDMAAAKDGARVLDVAAGAGEQTLAAARRVGTNGSVLATDISPAILDFALDAARRAGLDNVETLELDGERHDTLAEGSFEAAISRVGLIYFPDQQRALRGIRHALKPGGRFAAVVYSTPDMNPFFSIPVGIIRQPREASPAASRPARALLARGRGCPGQEPRAGRISRRRSAPGRFARAPSLGRRVRSLRARVLWRAPPDDGDPERGGTFRDLEGDRNSPRQVRDHRWLRGTVRDAGRSGEQVTRLGRPCPGVPVRGKGSGSGIVGVRRHNYLAHTPCDSLTSAPFRCRSSHRWCWQCSCSRSASSSCSGCRHSANGRTGRRPSALSPWSPPTARWLARFHRLPGSIAPRSRRRSAISCCSAPSARSSLPRAMRSPQLAARPWTTSH